MSEPTTAPAQQADHNDGPTTEALRRVVARFATAEQVEAAGYVFGAEHSRVGDAAVIYSRGQYRAGIITKVGRVNVTVTYTTETAIREAADPRYGLTEPVRSTKADRFANVAVRPAATVDPAAPTVSGNATEPSSDDAAASRDATGDAADTAPHAIPLREVDHNNECVGCGAHFAEPCHPTCPFQTGEFGPAVILRAAARRLPAHQAGVGYDIGGALWATAVDLVGCEHAVRLADQAREALTEYLVWDWGARAQPIRSQVVYRHGLFSDVDEIGRSQYAAAARRDGIDFDPDAFGEITR